MRDDTLGDRLTMAIRKSGKSDKQVALEAGVGSKWLSALKNDRMKAPSVQKLLAVAAACGVKGGYLLHPIGLVPLAEVPKSGDWHEAILADQRFSEDHRRALVVILDGLLGSETESKRG